MRGGVPVEPGMSAAEMLAEFMNTVPLHNTLLISERKALVGHFKLPALMFRFFELLFFVLQLHLKEREFMYL